MINERLQFLKILFYLIFLKLWNFFRHLAFVLNDVSHNRTYRVLKVDWKLIWSSKRKHPLRSFVVKSSGQSTWTYRSAVTKLYKKTEDGIRLLFVINITFFWNAHKFCFILKRSFLLLPIVFTWDVFIRDMMKFFKI